MKQAKINYNKSQMLWRVEWPDQSVDFFELIQIKTYSETFISAEGNAWIVVNYTHAIFESGNKTLVLT